MTRKRLNTIFLFIITSLFTFLSIGYSALQQDLMVSGDMSYLYDNLLYDVIKKEALNNGLASEYNNPHQDSPTGNGDKAIYYYTASSDEEGMALQDKINVLFAGHCWQMLRTTDTGGVKMIYNGVASGNQCSNSRSNGVGYASSEATSFSNGYYYGTNYDYDSNSNTFTLEGVVSSSNWNSSTYESLVGKYTCKSTTNDSCETLYLVEDYISDSSGVVVSMNANSPYYEFGTLSFQKSHETSLSSVGYMHNSNYEETILNTPTNSEYQYASSFTYSNGTYTLGSDKVGISGFDTDEKKASLNAHHYTCGNNTGTCTTLYYVYDYVDSVNVKAITLTGGKNINDALTEMLSSGTVNTNSSTIKTAIEAWYEKNLSTYHEFLEDTVYCNNRIIKELKAWSPSNGIVGEGIQFGEYVPTTNLSCVNTTDRFSIGNSSARITSPIGLMSSAEENLLNNSKARMTGSSYWLMSPMGYINGAVTGNIVGDSGEIGGNAIGGTAGLRPAISLKVNTTYSGGDGSMENPYIVSTGRPNPPTFDESEIENGVKTVTITYPEGCGTTYICKYKKNNETEVVVNDTTAEVPFTSSGIVQASVTVGEIVVSSRYRVSFNALYVSSSGNDTTGCGSIEEPYATLRKAYEMSEADSTIYVMTNITQNNKFRMNYNKNITITSCTKESNTSCPTSTANTITRGNSLTDNVISIENGTLTLNTITVDGNNVSSTSPMINNTTTLNLNTGTTLKRGKNSGRGGAVSNINGIVEVNGAIISNNEGDRGAGIYDYEGTVTIHSGTITSNHATGLGGGIWSSGDLVMDDGIISNNTSDNSGSGLHITATTERAGVFQLNGGTITGNSSGLHGGGVSVYGTEDLSASFIMTGGEISNNTAASYGGGITTSFSVTISGGTITGNTAVNRGGGIHGGATSSIEISGGTISNNQATTGDGYGGGLHVSGNFEMSNGTISNNTARTYGGGLFCSGTCTMSGGSITGNTATENLGGGIRVNGTFNISGGNIRSNTSPTNYTTYNISLRNNAASSLYDVNANHIADYTIYYVASGVNNNYVVNVNGGSTTNLTNINLYQNDSTNREKWRLLPSGVYDGIVYYRFCSLINNAFYIGVKDGTTSNGSNVIGYAADVVGNQQWGLLPAGSSYYYIRNANDSSTCMDLLNGTAANNQNIQLYACDNSTKQKWKLIDSSGVQKYTIKFNGNGNTGGSTANVVCTIGQSCTLTSNGFTKTNYKFLGWATTSTGAVTYTNGQAVTDLSTTSGATVNLYAVWRDSTKLYVSSSGNDTSGYGTIAKPYKTVSKAYTEAASTATIYLMSNITQTAVTTMNGGKTITLTSCTKSSDTACAYSSNFSLIRGGSFTDGFLMNNSSGTLNLTNVTINGNNVSATKALISNAGTLNINSGATLTKSVNSNSGGAVINTKTLTLAGGTISNNTALSGGGIMSGNTASTVTMSSGTITGNKGTATVSSGAGIYSYGTLKITGGTISNNVATGSGGGILSANKFTMTGGTITGNSSGTSGGGLNLTFNETNSIASVASITGGTISNNTATNGGGGMLVNSTSALKSTLTLGAVTISGNSAKTGGAVSINPYSTVTQTAGSYIKNKSTTYSGGAFYVKGTYKMSGGTIGGSSANANTSNTTGGGVMCQGACTISGGTISYNKGTSGAGVWSGDDATSCAISGGTFSNNTATKNGGGVGGITLSITGGTIKNNTAQNVGGGMFCYGTCGIKAVTISSNTATSSGGGIYVYKDCTLNVNASCTISSNTSNADGTDNNWGGGGIATNGTTNLKGSYTVIASNKAPKGKGGGVRIGAYGKVVMTAGTIKKNTATASGGVDKANGSTFTRSGGYICKNNSPTNSEDTTATTNENCA